MRIIGLDLSLTATGWCLLGDGFTWGTKRTPAKFRGDERLAWLSDEMDILISGNPDLVVIESASFNSRSGHVDEIAGLHRIVRLDLWRRGIPYVLVAPIQLKKFILGDVKADKSSIVLKVFQRWNIEAKDDNQADAIVLAQIGRALVGGLEELAAFQQQVVEKVTAKHRDVLEGLQAKEVAGG